MPKKPSSLLKKAIVKADIGALDSLLVDENPELLNAYCIGNHTPLSYALRHIKKGDRSIVRRLLTLGANPLLPVKGSIYSTVEQHKFSKEEWAIMTPKVAEYVADERLDDNIKTVGFAELKKGVYKNLEKGKHTSLAKYYDKSVKDCPYNALKQVIFCQNPKHRKRVNDIVDTLKNYHIPFIDNIIKIVALDSQSGLRIFFADGKNIAQLTFNKSDVSTDGSANFPHKQILIAAEAKGGGQEVACTLVHELTHYAIEKMYRNKALPYPPQKSDKQKDHLPSSPKQTRRRNFQAAQEETKHILMENSGDPDIGMVSSEIQNKIFDTTQQCYQKHIHDSEHIARMAEFVLKQYQAPEKGKAIQQGLQKMLSYTDKVIMQNMEKYIKSQQGRSK